MAGRNRPNYLTGQARAALASRAMPGTNEADAAQGIGGVDYLMTSETDSKDLIDEVG